MNNNQAFGLGRQVSIVIPRSGDLVSSKYLSFQLPSLTPSSERNKMKIFQFQNFFNLEEVLSVFANTNQIYLRDD